MREKAHAISSDSSNLLYLTMILSRMLKRSEISPNVFSPLSPEQTQQGPDLFKITTVSIKHVQPNCLCLSVSKTSHMVHGRGKHASFKSCVQSMGRMGNRECERVTTPGMEIIPQLLLGIWCINTVLEKH